jgi:peptide/nickel transport system substrate-binding protein
MSMTVFNRRQLLEGTAALGYLALPSLPVLAQTPKRGGTLRVSVDQAINKLNPLAVRVNPEYLVAEMLYSSLTRLGHDMTPVPDLAQSWSSAPDLTEWTFKLRSGVTFHDGSPCTAKDVVATFEAILDPTTASPARQNVGPIDTVTGPDDRTVIIKTKAPYADLPVAVAYTNAKILPATVIQSAPARLDREAIGTGPFKLVSFEPERLVVVERNPAYYDRARPYLDRVQVAVYPDPTSETSALIAGDTDLILNALPTEFRRLQRARGVTALRTPSGQFCNINFGCDTPPFSDMRVRQALALALDRKALVDFVAESYGTPGNDTPINPAYRFYSDISLKRPDPRRRRGCSPRPAIPMVSRRR